jgi:hypothetical protein
LDGVVQRLLDNPTSLWLWVPAFAGTTAWITAVIASAAKQSSFFWRRRKLDCFVAIAPRNDVDTVPHSRGAMFPSFAKLSSLQQVANDPKEHCGG